MRMVWNLSKFCYYGVLVLYCILISCSAWNNGAASMSVLRQNRRNRALFFGPSPASSSSMTTARSRGQMTMEFEWKSTIKKAAEEKMLKSLENVNSQFSSLRSTGAHPSILDRVMVDYVGSLVPLKQIARITVQNSQQLIVDPFDKASLREIEKAIVAANIKLSPQNDGTVIKISVPPLTEERRKEFVKQAKVCAEDGKVSMRNIRRDVIDKIRAAEKSKEISKDDSKSYQDDFQKVADEFVKKLDSALKAKEKDLMTI